MNAKSDTPGTPRFTGGQLHARHVTVILNYLLGDSFAALIALVAALILAAPASAQTYSGSVIYSFTGGNDGNGPSGSLIQAPDGNLYGTNVNIGGASRVATAGTSCPVMGSLACGSSVDGNITGACPDGNFEDFYDLTATAGENLIISMIGSFDVGMTLLDADGNTVAQGYSQNPKAATAAQLFYTVPSPGGTYTLVAEGFRFPYFNPPGPDPTGPYTLTVACVQQNCSSYLYSLCLNNERFAVQATYSSLAGSGQGNPISISDETGYFWFFTPANVELVTKIVNGAACGVDNRYWVFAAGLTNVGVTLTVTDTLTGQVQTYTNEQGVSFQPIQDTSTFAICP